MAQGVCGFKSRSDRCRAPCSMAVRDTANAHPVSCRVRVLYIEKATPVRINHAAEGLIGALHTTPWFYALSTGLFLVLVAAGFCYAASKFSKSFESADGCLVLLFGMVGFIFGVTGVICVCLGLFGWF